ncbi:phosphoglycolate phosphatase [Crenobacter luteus]|uniref:HAD family hydrolase n=1 Tax=Crenobacter luteus TaxID=1452487 RepID=A0A165ELZ6_9NEIS|nr:HAD-IIIA family hydrolase [Crenobacter luteus]KZE25893.1 HAD family hydrolase [Crenobacter luteus]TCP14550.1 phosphoglycolate phosphatase [Crenobacter luteus]
MAKTFDLIVFDWDGTLMDSTAHIVRSIQRACADLDLPIPPRERASHVIGLGLVDAMRHVCPGLEPARYQDMVVAYRDHYLKGDEAIELFDGVSEGLAELKAQGAFLAVATGKSRAGLDRVLAKTGLAGLFDATRTVDECHSKPHPSMLLELTDHLGVDTRRTLMVGDTTHDLMMAQNAGTHGAGVSYGAHPVGELAACAPLGIFDTYPDLHAWLLPQLN